ncbi:portal protein [Pseudanabaena phage Pam4]|nr:portal protein [Pseudanabaena phage Pam4]
MPRPTKAKTAPNSLVASAARITGRTPRGVPRDAANGSAGWQVELWNLLDEVGELDFYRMWVANALSRVTLHIERDTPDGTERVKNGLAVEAIQGLFRGEAGQPEMMAAFGSLLSIPGEAWLVGLLNPPAGPDAPDQWRVLSRDEVKKQGSRWIIDRGDGVMEGYESGDNGAEPEAYVLRVWQPHPRKWVDATSSARAAIPILRELVGLTKHVAASVDSRLAGAGLLLVPSEMTFASPTPGEDPTDPDADPFLADLIDTMATAIRDRDSAEAKVPLVVKAPGALLQHVKHITFATPFDERTRELREEALRRLANSLNVPAEVLTGMAAVNHWTGWLLDENAIKMHIEPLVAVVTSALTTRWLWPILQGQADSLTAEQASYRVVGDTSALRQRPNRTAEAMALHTGLTITDAALARETGFDGDDLLDPASDEYRRRVLQRLVQVSNDPAVIAAAVTTLGGRLDLPESTDPGPGPTGTPAALPAAETRNPPEQTAALLVGAEMLVLRAVERAWNRASKRSKGPRGAIAPDALDACLAGAWEHAPRVAAMTGLPCEDLTAALDSYTRTLLTSGTEHHAVTLMAYLSERLGTTNPLAVTRA